MSGFIGSYLPPVMSIAECNVCLGEGAPAAWGRLPSLASVAEGRSDRQTFASKQTIFEDEKR
jgi:hypothetical protein